MDLNSGLLNSGLLSSFYPCVFASTSLMTLVRFYITVPLHLGRNTTTAWCDLIVWNNC